MVNEYYIIVVAVEKNEWPFRIYVLNQWPLRIYIFKSWKIQYFVSPLACIRFCH